MLDSSSSFHSNWTVGVDVNNCRTRKLSFRVYYRIAGGASLLSSSMWKWSSEFCSVQYGLGCLENLLKWIHIGPKWKWTPKCHILWDTGSLWVVCMGASPVGWNNQAAGISWRSWRQGMAEEGGLHSRIPVPHRWGLAYPCRTSPSCQVLALVLCCIPVQMNNPVKGTNVLQKSHCCPACFLLTDIHL